MQDCSRTVDTTADIIVPDRGDEIDGGKVKISGGKVSFGGREEVRKVRKGPHTKSNKVTKIATMGEESKVKVSPKKGKFTLRSKVYFQGIYFFLTLVVTFPRPILRCGHVT